ncbi:MAG: CvpA family protein [Acutalibacteraceae bacterium]
MAAAIVANCHFVLYFGDIGTLSNKINRQCISFAVLRQVDGILGGLFGIFKGVVYIFLVCILLQLLMPVIGNSSEPMKQVLDNSFIYQFIFYNNPITSWFI